MIRVVVFALLMVLVCPLHADDGEWISIAWHDVDSDVADSFDLDTFAVDVKYLAEQFDWLAVHGWTPVSIDQILAAGEGGKALPKKAVLLTFDDGLASMYTHVYPLLQAYGYPAVASVVTSWMEKPDDWSISYQSSIRGRDGFLTWEQVREMMDSGLVEIASHSHDLHRGILANPQGNALPAATNRQYLSAQARYETEREWRDRIHKDLQTSVELIEARTGRPPRVMVWPYGEFNQGTEQIARDLGMSVSLGVDTGSNPTGQLSQLKRFLVTRNPDIEFFSNSILSREEKPGVQRVAHIDLDYVYDPDPAQQAANLDLLIERIHNLNITTVYLQAFADPDGDGTASALYFPNRHLPVRADLFNRVAWQLRTRAGVSVYGWLPVLSFDLEDRKQARDLGVRRFTAKGHEQSRADYRRLSPFLPAAREIIQEIYSDLASHAFVDGILYHDDAYLSEEEGASACLPQATWPDGGAIQDCRLTTAQKTGALIDFTDALTRTVRAWRPLAATARNLYARPILEPESEKRFSQSLPAFLEAYDTTAIMAMPLLEGAADADKWLLELVDAVRQHPQGLERSLFELQARDWRDGSWIPAKTLQAQMRLLVRNGAVNLGYYPDDFINNRPAREPLFQAISSRTFPYRGHGK